MRAIIDYNQIFYPTFIGVFCLNFAYGMPYEINWLIINEIIKSALTGIGVGCLFMVLGYFLESANNGGERT